MKTLLKEVARSSLLKILLKIFQGVTTKDIPGRHYLKILQEDATRDIP